MVALALLRLAELSVRSYGVEGIRACVQNRDYAGVHGQRLSKTGLSYC